MKFTPATSFGEHEGVATVERQLVHALLVDDAAAVGRGGFEQRHFGGHGDLLRAAADLQLEVHHGRLTDIYVDIFPDQLLKAGRFRRDRVRARPQIRSGVDALRRGNRRRDLVSFHVSDLHGNIGDGRP